MLYVYAACLCVVGEEVCRHWHPVKRW